MRVLPRISGVLAVIGQVLLVASTTVPAAAENMIRFTTEPTPVGLIHWWAEEKGIFEKNGLKYTDTLVNAAYIGLQGIGAGSNDVASMTEPPIVTHIAKGIDAIIVANLAQSTEVFKMVAPKSIKSVEDLKGKKVTWMGGTGAEYAMIRFLEPKGMKASDFEFINLPPAEEVPTLLNGGATAMWSWEPWPRKVLTLRPDDFHVIGASSVQTYEANMIMVVRRKFAEENPGALKLYLKSLIEATEQMNANPKEAVALYAKKLRTSMDEAQAAFNDYKTGVWLDDRIVNTLLDVSAYLKAQGRFEKEPDWKSLIDPSFLREVDASRVKLSN